MHRYMFKKLHKMKMTQNGQNISHNHLFLLETINNNIRQIGAKIKYTNNAIIHQCQCQVRTAK